MTEGGRFMKLWLKIAAGILLVLVLAGLGGFLYLRSSLPKVSGSERVRGLAGQVEIVRDAYGVPRIFASTDADAFFALGYVHAQDRMWQLELQRRIGAGRLSEVLGEATLETDKFLRTLGPYRAAEASWEAISPESQAALTAYTAGVNAWLEGGHTLPPEFMILGFEPEPWQETDSLVWIKMMSWDLGGNYTDELLRAKLVQALGPERAGDLFPPYPEDGPTALAEHAPEPEMLNALLAMSLNLQENFQLGGMHIGSNNWVLGGERTETEQPLLANDPHLGAQIPSVWYLAELQGDNLHVTGATFPGLPLVVIGHNDDIAWGVTNLPADVQDLYMERLNPQDLNQYEVDGEWEDLTIVEEVIQVKDVDEPLRWAARSTRNGPLISDVSGAAQMPLALRWTALDPDDTTMDAFLQLNYARNWDEFVTALESYIAPSQNVVYADTEGNIGYYGPGRIPIRAQGDGTVPVPGWDSDYAWAGWIPFDEMPHAFNPASNYIATANNRSVPLDYPYLLSNNWAAPYRAERIVEQIEAMSRRDETISMLDMEALIGDQESTQTRQLLPALLDLETETERQAQALSYLQDWDGQMAIDSPAPAIYHAWLKHLGPVIFEDDLPPDLFDTLVNSRDILFLETVINSPDAVWCDNYLTVPAETCADISLKALDLALEDLSERMGDSMAGWTWGEIHQTQYPHNPFSQVDSLRRFFHRSIPNGGDTYTVNVAPIRYREGYDQYNVPSYRQLIDLSDWNNSLFMHSTGQSGNLLSPHYDDLIAPHQAVEFIPMTFGRAAATGEVLVLRPE
jgi:penicillin amidase